MTLQQAFQDLLRKGEQVAYLAVEKGLDLLEQLDPVEDEVEQDKTPSPVSSRLNLLIGTLGDFCDPDLFNEVVDIAQKIYTLGYDEGEWQAHKAIWGDGK